MAPKLPILVIANNVSEFDKWLKSEFNESRTSSRSPVSATVKGTVYQMQQLNSRSNLGRSNFSRIIWIAAEDKAYDWFKDLVNSRVKTSPIPETIGQPIKRKSKS